MRPFLLPFYSGAHSAHRRSYFQLGFSRIQLVLQSFVCSFACVNMSMIVVSMNNVQCIMYNYLDQVENNGFEPLTLCLQSRCSSQLS